MPDASKMNVFASPSAPWAAISFPFRMKLTPAVLPMRATISRLPLMAACAGAMRVSWLTSWPSAVTEIQDVSLARITSVSVAATGDLGLAAAGVRAMASFLMVFAFCLVGAFCGISGDVDGVGAWLAAAGSVDEATEGADFGKAAGALAEPAGKGCDPCTGGAVVGDCTAGPV